MTSDIKRKLKDLQDLLGFYVSRVISWPLVPPEHVYFSLTNRCNLRCSMCEISKHPSLPETELSTAKIKEIIRQIKDLSIGHIIFSGGEPLLRDDLVELVEFAVGNDIGMVDIITNGVLLKENIIKNLIRSGLNHITISLDGIGQVNNKIRGADIFDIVESNIDKLNYHKTQQNLSLPTLGINFTIMDSNISDILPMVEFAKSKKCNIVVFQPILFNNTKMHVKKRNSLWPVKENISKLRSAIKELEKIKRNSTDINIFTDFEVLRAIPGYFEGKKPQTGFKCYEAIKRIVITCDGNLWSCMGTYGNLEKESLREIWFSKSAMEVRSKVKRCNEHCLQDCVYFPSDFVNKIRLISNDSFLDDEKSLVMRNEILEQIEEYIKVLSERNKSQPEMLNRIFGSQRMYQKEIDRLLLARRLLNDINYGSPRK